MRKIFSIILSVLLFQLSFAQKPIKIAVISDVHYLSAGLVKEGKTLREYEKNTGRNLQDLYGVFDEALQRIKKSDCDIVFVSGDLTKDGELQSHLEFSQKMEDLKKCGKRVFVIPGNHDVNVPTSKGFRGDSTYSVKNVSTTKFAEIYKNCGYGNALKRDDNSLSYLAELDENTWLICLDSNKYKEYKTTTISSGRLYEKTLKWTLNILDEAKRQSKKVIAMMHHGLVEHMPYQSTFFAPYLLDDWKNTANLFADKGLKVIFTGHFHSTDISRLTTPKGNTIHDVETGSLAQYAFPISFVTVSSDSLYVETQFIDSIKTNAHLSDKYKSQLQIQSEMMAKNKILSLMPEINEKSLKLISAVIAQINVLHVKGNEVMSEELLNKLSEFSRFMNDDSVDFKSFQLDFPPKDTEVWIPF